MSEFAPGSTTPTATLTGLTDPVALAFDSSGDLFVANYGSGTVSEFAPGSTTPTATLTGLTDPYALAFDSSGNLFVANGNNPGTVSEFAPGSTTPTATLTGLTDPHALAFDSSGNLYVANDIWYGERVRTGEHYAHRHLHRAERPHCAWRSTPTATSTSPTTLVR